MKNIVMRKGLGWVNLIGLVMGICFSGVGETVWAAAPGAVVINEVAWAGSVNSANDEWIEFYNPGGTAVDLSGWKLRYNGSDIFTFPAGSSVGAQGFYLLERSEAATSVTADGITSMTLSNSGASLELLDAAGTSIDLVNSAKAAWFAGNATTRATMERKDALASGDLASNWASSTGSGATASAGGAIIGTPKATNSVAVAQPVSSAAVKINLSSVTPLTGDVVKATVQIENVTDLFAYGLEIRYDPQVLQLQTVTQGSFLSDTGTVATSFNSGLKSGTAGDLLIAEARTVDTKTGKSGSGTLLEVDFKVSGAAGATSAIGFDPVGTFAANASSDLSLNWVGNSLTVKDGTIEPVSGLQSGEGAGRYQIRLSWTASVSTPDHYRIERKDAHGNWVVLAGVTGTEFTDQDGVAAGGKIIPGLAYQYKVTAVKGTLLSTAVEISGADSRGLRGDNNRSDLVDGRDLEKLARIFGLTDAQSGFDALVDTTYDARVDGSDLIDLGANFAHKY